MMRKQPIVLSDERLEKLHSSLNVGDVIDGVVVMRVDDERYVVRYDDVDFVAGYTGFLSVGAKIRTLVLMMRPQMMFKILSPYDLPFDVSTQLGAVRKVIRSSPQTLFRFVPSISTIAADVRSALAKVTLTGSKCERIVKPYMPVIERVMDVVQLNAGVPAGDMHGFFDAMAGRRAVVQAESVACVDQLCKAGTDKAATLPQEVIDALACMRESVRRAGLFLAIEEMVNKRSLRQLHVAYGAAAEKSAVVYTDDSGAVLIAVDGPGYSDRAVFTSHGAQAFVSDGKIPASVAEYCQYFSARTGIRFDQGEKGRKIPAVLAGALQDLHIFKALKFNVVI